jgi:hypothetical protein
MKKITYEVMCDFCGADFSAENWNSRTCWECRAKGAPDQSELDYDQRIIQWRKLTGRERKPGRPRK